MNHFGELLREARLRARLTQRDVAKKVDVHDTYVSKMETGVESPPSRKVALRLADVLRLTEKADRLRFLLAAGVACEEDMKGLQLVEAGRGGMSGGAPPIIAAAFGSGSRLGTILSRSSTGQQQTVTASQQRNHDIGLLIAQTLAEVHLPPETRILAERLILENVRSVCDVLAQQRDRPRR